MFSPYIHIHVFFLFSNSLSTHAPTQLLRPSAALYLVSGHRHVTLVPRDLDTSHITVEWVLGTRDGYNNVIVTYCPTQVPEERLSSRRSCQGPSPSPTAATPATARMYNESNTGYFISSPSISTHKYIFFSFFQISGYNPDRPRTGSAGPAGS